MDRKKLIFFAAADPREDPGPAWSAYHFANVAGGAGLEAEVRLAGDAVLAAREDGIPSSERGEQLRQKVAEGADGPFLVSL
jgi:hypothetical protein